MYQQLKEVFSCFDIEAVSCHKKEKSFGKTVSYTLSWKIFEYHFLIATLKQFNEKEYLKKKFCTIDLIFVCKT